jgi:hypothetical protein
MLKPVLQLPKTIRLKEDELPQNNASVLKRWEKAKWRI